MSNPEEITNEAAGEPRTIKSTILETGAAATQNFGPIKSICAHLNAFHVYATDPSRCVESNHYCTHLNEDVRQCLIYDKPEPASRLIGIEYMITPKLYETLPSSEQRLWHSHVYEVKSGMLIMPNSLVPASIWEVAETKEMEQVVALYGKTYHFWQIDRGDTVPMGEPQLMMSFTEPGQIKQFEGALKDRDERYGVSTMEKSEKRKYIEEPQIHAGADSMWKRGSTTGEKGEKS